MTKRARVVVLLSLSALLFGCDVASKGVAEANLPGAPISLIDGVLDLRYTQNHGVAFNVLRMVPASVKRIVIFVVGFLVLPMVILLWYRHWGEPLHQQLGYALIVAGALGNLVDRLVRGYVVDFIHVHHWPIFNVADICVVGGAMWLLLFHRHHLQTPTETS